MNSSETHPAPGRSSNGVAWTLAIGAVFIAAMTLFIAQAVRWDNFPAQIQLDKSAWRAILINFLYFTPLAAGMVVWPAVVLASHGKWSGRLDRAAMAAWTFAPISLVTLAVLWLGQAQWAPWAQAGEKPTQGAWLNSDFLLGRDLWALATFWIVAFIFVRRRRFSHPAKLAVALIIAYCLTFSLIGFDLVMALDPKWYSSLFGGYFFISGMYAAVAAWALASIISGLQPERKRLHDLGKLLVAFSILTAYLAYSQVLPIWYEDLPQEIRFLTVRLQKGYWPYVGLGLLLTIYVGPLALLLTTRSKRTAPILSGVAALVLAGLWFERWYLVAPTPVASLGTGGMILGWADLELAAAMATLLAICIRAGLPTVQTMQQEAPDQ